MSAERELRFYMNLMAFDSFPPNRGLRRSTFQEGIETLKDAGFSGVQFPGFGGEAALADCRRLHMGITSGARINEVPEVRTLAEKLAGDGYESATLHLGWGLEDDAAASALIESVLGAASRWKIPLYIETHRATICQDIWRTVQFVHRFPEMRFNGDFSHWYAGQEMVYGGFASKLAFIRPVLDRVGFIHGRIANPGCIQVAVEAETEGRPEYVDHFRQMWTMAFRGFLNRDEAPAFLCFTPELLAPEIYYARTFGGVEESDRWQQSLLLNEMAKECFTCAKSS